MADELLKAWLRQAHADLQAGRSEGSADCHRRYWLQQACERASRPSGWCSGAVRQRMMGSFALTFLHNHSPLRRLEVDVNANPALPKSLRRLLRQIETEFSALDGDGLLRKVDAMTPTTAPTGVSYRYPFHDAEKGEDVAPTDWTATEWDAYQGNATGVAAAIERFLKAIENRRRRGRVGPRSLPKHDQPADAYPEHRGIIVWATAISTLAAGLSGRAALLPGSVAFTGALRGTARVRNGRRRPTEWTTPPRRAPRQRDAVSDVEQPHCLAPSIRTETSTECSSSGQDEQTDSSLLLSLPRGAETLDRRLAQRRMKRRSHHVRELSTPSLQFTAIERR